MNDITVKIVEAPKVLGDVTEQIVLEKSSDKEVDPLAIDDVVDREKVSILDTEVKLEKSEEPDAVESCDDQAKEIIESENQVKDFVKSDLLSEEIKEKLLNDHITSIETTVESDIKNGTKSRKSSPTPMDTTDQEQPLQAEVSTPVVPENIAVTINNSIKAPTQLEVSENIEEKPSTPPSEVEKPQQVPKIEEPKCTDKSKEPVDMVPTPALMTEKMEPVIEMAKPDVQPVNGDINKDDQPIKRRSSEEIETESPLKKLCQEVERTFPKHDSMINDYIQTATKSNIDDIQRHTEQLLSEIQTLRELAQKKEHEWNNILHLKKVKEEILLRLLRRKQVISFEKSTEVNGANCKDPFDYLNQSKNLAIDKSDEISGLALKPPTSMGSNPNLLIQPPVMPVAPHFNPMAGLPPPYDKAAHMQGLQKPMYPQTLMMPGPTMPFPREMNGQLGNFGLPMGRQGPTKDVKSIIADYRQRNPDSTPRRGRRMKSILNPNMMNAPRQIAPKIDNLNNLGMIFNNLDMNQKAMLERLSQMQAGSLPNGMSFKDVLVQFANIQQHNPGLMPNRPEMMSRPEQHPIRPDNRRRPDRPPHEEVHVSVKQNERVASSSPRLPPPPPYPEISLLPVSNNNQEAGQQGSLLHGILTKQAPTAPQGYSPTLAKLLTSPEQKSATLPTFGQAKNCGEITITPVQPSTSNEAQSEKAEEVVQLDDEESPQSEGSGAPSPEAAGRLVIDEAGGGASGGAAGSAGGEADAPLCQGCRRRDAQFVCAGCANQWYCSRDCQVAAWDDHSEMCSG